MANRATHIGLNLTHYTIKLREGRAAGWQKISGILYRNRPADKIKIWGTKTARRLNIVSFHMIITILEAFRRWGAMEANSSSFFAAPPPAPHGFMQNIVGQV
jgi:hypothetical protein